MSVEKHVEGKPMAQKRKHYSGQFKFKVALEAASQLASETGVHPTQIGQWKRQLLEEGVEFFSHNGSGKEQNGAKVEAELYEQIGRLKMELEWLKKKAT